MTTIILGSQWGDEGKGKLTDILCSQAQICARAAVRFALFVLLQPGGGRWIGSAVHVSISFPFWLPILCFPLLNPLAAFF